MLNDKNTHPRPSERPNAPIWYLVDGHPVYGVPDARKAMRNAVDPVEGLEVALAAFSHVREAVA